MKITVDKETDTLYFRLDENKIVESEEVRPGVILDFDENDTVIGVEFLNVSSRATKEDLSNMQFQSAWMDSVFVGNQVYWTFRKVLFLIAYEQKKKTDHFRLGH